MVQVVSDNVYNVGHVACSLVNFSNVLQDVGVSLDKIAHHNLVDGGLIVKKLENVHRVHTLMPLMPLMPLMLL
jgi:hypothetical protein